MGGGRVAVRGVKDERNESLNDDGSLHLASTKGKGGRWMMDEEEWQRRMMDGRAQ